ncbi:MAG: alanine dehydrogenase [Alphaproteobacteria bacterium]
MSSKMRQPAAKIGQTIGIPTEMKPNERRVALTPTACAALVKLGHRVLLQQGAGERAGYSDKDYRTVGAELAKNAKALYQNATIIVKVKEPQRGDLKLLKPHHTLFCYLHLAGEPQLAKALPKLGLTAYAFETVVLNGKTPLLAPMSAIAGRLSMQLATWHLHAPRGGRGVLLGGALGKEAGHVTIIGGGVAGTEAATLALGMGAHVTLLDINPARLAALKQQLPRLRTEVSSPAALNALLPSTDVLVSGVYVIGRKAPTVVDAKQLKLLPKGAVVVDIAIDQGGSIAGIQQCTHKKPVYTKNGVLFSAIPNLPAAAPHTASALLAEAITPYVAQLARGELSAELAGGVNVAGGKLMLAM